MIRETRVDRWESKTHLPVTLSSEEVLALIPKHFSNAERVEVLTPFANYWKRQYSEMYLILHHQIIRVYEGCGYSTREFRRHFGLPIDADHDDTIIMDMAYERDTWRHLSDKYTWKEIKANLNSFSELINKLSK